jgi:hypothetical protein
MEALKTSSDTLFILLGAIMVLAMHAGFAFLEVGTVRRKNQVNALVKILCDFSMSTIAYFFIGYAIAYGASFMTGAEKLADKNGYDLVKFFFLLTFAAAVPAIISGGIAERARFTPQLVATALVVAVVYPFFEGIAWNDKYGVQAAGSRSSRWSCLERGPDAIPRMAGSRHSRRRAYPSSRWVRGCSPSAGSGSTSCRRRLSTRSRDWSP